MIKTFIILSITLALSGCSAISRLANHENTNQINHELSNSELEKIKISKIVRNKLNKNWIQSKLYKRDDISCIYCVSIDQKGNLKDLRLCNVFCGINNDDNECQTFVENTKRSIIKTFPVRELAGLFNHNLWDDCLYFESKERNALFKQAN